MDHRQRGLWKSDRCGRLKWPPNFGPVFDIGLGAAPVAPDAARGDEADGTEDGRGAEHFPVGKIRVWAGRDRSRRSPRRCGIGRWSIRGLRGESLPAVAIAHRHPRDVPTRSMVLSAFRAV